MDLAFAGVSQPRLSTVSRAIHVARDARLLTFHKMSLLSTPRLLCTQLVHHTQCTTLSVSMTVAGTRPFGWVFRGWHVALVLVENPVSIVREHDEATEWD